MELEFVYGIVYKGGNKVSLNIANDNLVKIKAIQDSFDKSLQASMIPNKRPSSNRSRFQAREAKVCYKGMVSHEVRINFKIIKKFVEKRHLTYQINIALH